MSEPTNPRHAALLRAWAETGGDVEAATAAYFETAAPPDPPTPPPADAIGESETAGAVRNPHRKPGDPAPAALARLSSSELDELEAADAGLVDRVLAAEDWDRRRAAATEREEREAKRLAEEAATASDPDALERHFAEHDIKRFREMYWQLSPGQRRAEAERLGLDLSTFEPPTGAFGAAYRKELS